MPYTLPAWLVKWDIAAWTNVNNNWNNGFLDFLVPFVRNQFTWAPLYLFLLVFMLWNFGWRGVAWCGAFLLCFALADQLSAHLMKPLFQRSRPCNTEGLKNTVHLLVECGSGLSFPSSHAANHFALSTFIGFTLSKYGRWVWPAAMLWAFSVAYAQVYVGVHFPVDVIVGALVGMLVGVFVFLLYRKMPFTIYQRP